MTDSTHEDDHPYSLVFERNGIVYVSGAVSVPTYKPMQGRKEALDAALDEVGRRLASVGLDLSSIVKMTYFLTDITLRNEANQQFVERFSPPRPARSVVGVARNFRDSSVMIEAIAHR